MYTSAQTHTKYKIIEAEAAWTCVFRVSEKATSQGVWSEMLPRLEINLSHV